MFNLENNLEYLEYKLKGIYKFGEEIDVKFIDSLVQLVINSTELTADNTERSKEFLELLSEVEKTVPETFSDEKITYILKEFLDNKSEIVNVTLEDLSEMFEEFFSKTIDQTAHQSDNLEELNSEKYNLTISEEIDKEHYDIDGSEEPDLENYIKENDEIINSQYEEIKKNDDLDKLDFGVYGSDILEEVELMDNEYDIEEIEIIEEYQKDNGKSY